MKKLIVISILLLVAGCNSAGIKAQVHKKTSGINHEFIEYLESQDLPAVAGHKKISRINHEFVDSLKQNDIIRIALNGGINLEFQESLEFGNHEKVQENKIFLSYPLIHNSFINERGSLWYINQLNESIEQQENELRERLFFEEFQSLHRNYKYQNQILEQIQQQLEIQEHEQFIQRSQDEFWRMQQQNRNTFNSLSGGAYQWTDGQGNTHGHIPIKGWMKKSIDY